MQSAEHVRDEPATLTADPSPGIDRGSFADTIIGAADIAFVLYGDRKQVAKIYKLRARTSVPIFRFNGSLAVRRSDLERWLNDQARKFGP